jgi:hypothetical protein
LQKVSAPVLERGGTRVAMSAIALMLEHDPEKWTPVFRKDHAQTID